MNDACAEQRRSRVWLEIDLALLRANFHKIREAVAPAGVVAVLKANAYGLGVAPIARALCDAGIAGIGVAEPREALALTGLGVPVQILGGILSEEVTPELVAHVTLPVTDLEIAGMISRVALATGRPATVHFLVDTGMGRLGIPADEAVAVIAEAVRLPGLNAEGIYSHFPAAYRGGNACTQAQVRQFRAVLVQLEARGIRFTKRHCANSDAVNNFTETFREPFNLVRTGINLHGSFDMEGQRTLDLKSILTLKTRLVAVRRLPAGATIGYGCTYRLPRESLVGTISAGYADGLPLALSNRGYVLVRGRPCPVLGRVSMDYTTVALDQMPDARCGDEVVCLGGEGPARISVEDWAQLKGTHSYEIICSFGSRVERRYLESP
jgi:alanine racemase